MSGLEQNPLIKHIETLTNLPTLPHILLRVIESCNKEETSFAELSLIIEKDPSLSSKILRVVNSSLYAVPNKIGSLKQAISFIGFDALKNIALCASIHEVFSGAQENPQFNLKRFWKHSLYSAVLAKLIAQKVRYENQEEAFLSGLLHDIGKLILWVLFPKEYGQILETVKGQSDRLLSEELKLGALHSEIGAWLIEKWNLRSLMADAVRYHHEPMYRIIDAFPLVKIVFCANLLISDSQGTKDNRLEVAKTLFSFSRDAVETLIRRAEGELLEAARSLEIKIDTASESVRDQTAQDQRKKEILRQEIKSVSLLLGTLQNIAKAFDEEDLIRILFQSLRILFGVQEGIFFRYDFEKNLLQGRRSLSDNGNVFVRELLIPFQVEKSILVESLDKRRMVDSLRIRGENPLSLIDEQIVRLLKNEGILCLPLTAGKARVGVLAIGIDRSWLDSLVKQGKLLELLLSQIALALHSEQLRKQQLQTIQSERIAASSTLAQKVVHETNNPLGIIKNYLKILDLKLQKERVVMEEIQIINGEIDRIMHMLEGLAEFAEPKLPEPDTVNVNELIGDILSISAESFLQTAKVYVHTNFDTSLVPFAIQRDSLKQIIINLLKNAVEAMPGGGNLTITTRYLRGAYSDAIPEGMPREKASSSGYAEITVSDDGPGIPETVQAKLFEPFVSTKGTDHQGLGLSIVYSTVKGLHGSVTYMSSRDTGTSFILLFPVRA